MITINNLFDSYNFKPLGITLTAYGHLSLAILNDSEVSVKPVAIQFISRYGRKQRADTKKGQSSPLY